LPLFFSAAILPLKFFKFPFGVTKMPTGIVDLPLSIVVRKFKMAAVLAGTEVFAL
jgi:hypothetical protein